MSAIDSFSGVFNLAIYVFLFSSVYRTAGQDTFKFQSRADRGDWNYIYPMTYLNKLALFKSEESILSLFRREEVKDHLNIRAFLNAYKSCFWKDDIKALPEYRKPFIVVEGNNLTARRELSKRLSGHHNVGRVFNPPQCLFGWSRIFPRGDLLKKASFQLGLYAAAFTVRQWLNKGLPVFMDGYWTDQASYIIARIYKTIDDLPKKGSPMYEEPEDLMLPDLVLYLDFEMKHLDRFSNYSSNIDFDAINKVIYSNFKYTPVAIVKVPNDMQDAFDIVMEVIQSKLSKQYDLTPAKPKV
uniref:Uncharacterized protein n=1 Tax=Clastoptera arizonana TaxID=38151 RepID=A0A1B6CBL2_9HEMI